jgi:hypothetical protein
VTLYDSDGDDADCWRRIEVPHRPAEQVYSLQQVERRANDKTTMAEFIRKIGNTNISVVSVDALSAHLDTLDIPTKVRDRVRDLVSEQSCQ